MVPVGGHGTLMVPTTRHTTMPSTIHHQAIEGGHDTLVVPIDSESTVIIVVFYDVTWFKGNYGRYQFKDYQSKVIEMPRNCTYAQLIDEVYKIVKVDREKYNVKMKYQYIVSYQPCAPQEINSDQDVKIFIHIVKTIMPVTPLYVKIISNFAEVYFADERNNDTYAKFTVGSGNTHISTSCVAIEIGEREKGEKYVNVSDVEEAQLRESQISQSPIRETQNLWENVSYWQSEVPKTCTPWETCVEETQTHFET
ncbi:hypothetical protein FNV43_RR10413 [Rhamnella rubrinervis]|uniref:Uncharacterized protein n=1 Tax=Rhamnella rubrinervis TaxID=2594499 RepID=A0A8K0HBU3_9ROSA|nr:hypothetical protein FNV43_RR10413 [Rhamnella rubrinervis]